MLTEDQSQTQIDKKECILLTKSKKKLSQETIKLKYRSDLSESFTPEQYKVSVRKLKKGMTLICRELLKLSSHNIIKGIYPENEENKFVSITYFIDRKKVKVFKKYFKDSKDYNVEELQIGNRGVSKLRFFLTTLDKKAISKLEALFIKLDILECKTLDDNLASTKAKVISTKFFLSMPSDELKLHSKILEQLNRICFFHEQSLLRSELLAKKILKQIKNEGLKIKTMLKQIAKDLCSDINIKSNSTETVIDLWNGKDTKSQDDLTELDYHRYARLDNWYKKLIDLE